jgi:hypothetical protein
VESDLAFFLQIFWQLMDSLSWVAFIGFVMHTIGGALMFRNVSIILVFLAINGIVIDGFAGECDSYDQIQAKLNGKYGEQMIFSGFADSEENHSANVIYELWANPERGNWSLISNKLIMFQYDVTADSNNCVYMVNSGKQHHLVATRHDMQIEPEKTVKIEEEPADQSALYNCVPRGVHAQALKTRHDEIPVLQALDEEAALIEVYGSHNSWTITRVKSREVRNVMTGAPLTDIKTGQEIHQLCSSPAFSGKTWSLYPFKNQHI